MVEERQEHSTPPLSIDRWMWQCGVQKTINQLLLDLVSAHPDDVITFIHRWSAQQQKLQREQKRDVLNQSFFVKHNGVENSRNQEIYSDKEQSHLLEWPLNDETEWGNNTQENSNNSNIMNWERTGEPTIEELQSLYRDALESPFEFLIDIDHLEEKMRCKRAISLSANSLGLCVNRGNYGFVVPAMLKTDAEAKGNIIGNRENNEVYTTVHRTITEKLTAHEQCQMVAIKVSRVQALWSLDEANHLKRITSCSQLLEEEVRELKEELNTRRCSHVHDAEYDAFQAFSPSENTTLNQLETHLKVKNTLLQGARLVTHLIGEVMYDAQRDFLLFPLVFYPSSLRESIRERVKLCSGSISSGCPFPNFSVNDTGGTVMAVLFSVQEIQHVARSLCYALHFLNISCGLCHLDVKVDNILLSAPWVSSRRPELTTSTSLLVEQSCDETSFPRVVLGDFGLAQPLGTPIMQLGDFSTMSPEVYWAFKNDDVNYTAYRTPVFCASSDMWSVGCVLLHMINGLEYGAWEALDMFDALDENHVSPALRHPEVWPMELNDFIVRCFERDPRRRMQASDALRHPFLA